MGHDGWTLALDAIKTAGILAGGAWAFWRFRLERIDAPQIEFSVDATLHGPSEGQYIAEYILTFANRGRTRVQIERIELRVRGMKLGAEPGIWEEQRSRAYFPDELVDDDAVIPPTYGYTFFEPGITQEYRYVSCVPADYRFLLVRGQFFYAVDMPHSAERVISVAQIAPAPASPVLARPDPVRPRNLPVGDLLQR